jgi:hypothetical protein
MLDVTPTEERLIALAWLILRLIIVVFWVLVILSVIFADYTLPVSD